MDSDAYELTVVPRAAVRFPLVMPAPEGFDPTVLPSWPEVPGRVEYVKGNLLYLPPCGDLQQETATDVVTELNLWRRSHPEFAIGSNEAGMLLGGEVRAADAAVWRRSDMAPDTGGLPRVAPILVVEVAGKDESMDDLSDKARWYIEHGVLVVWLVDPATRSARVITPDRVTEVAPEAAMPAHPALPGLALKLEDFFRQLSTR